MIASHARPEPGIRTEGCTERCRLVPVIELGVLRRSALLVHDPVAHEAYGRLLGAAEGAMPETVETSGLVVNLDSMAVTVNGRPAPLSTTELRLLVVLARQVGRLLLTEEVITRVWGPEYLAAPAPSYVHLLRMTMYRLRHKIAPLGGLVVRIPRLGVRLEAVPTDQPPPPIPTGSAAALKLPPGAWALDWACCRVCGTTERAHNGRGMCTRCHRSWRFQTSKEMRA